MMDRGDDTAARFLILCEQAQQEQNPQRLIALCQKICEYLDDQRRTMLDYLTKQATEKDASPRSASDNH